MERNHKKTPFLFPFICGWVGIYLFIKNWGVNIWVSIFGFLCFCYGLSPRIEAIKFFINHSPAAKKFVIGFIVIYIIIAGVLVYVLS